MSNDTDVRERLKPAVGYTYARLKGEIKP